MKVRLLVVAFALVSVVAPATAHTCTGTTTLGAGGERFSTCGDCPTGEEHNHTYTSGEIWCAGEGTSARAVPAASAAVAIVVLALLARRR